MKKFVFSLFFGLLFTLVQPSVTYAQKVSKSTPHSATAQRRLPDDGGGGPTQPLAPGALFVGEWEWTAGGEVFRLTITRNPAYVFSEFPNLPPRNVVICHFAYRRNGVVVDQSLTTGQIPYAALGSPVNNSSIEMLFYESGTKGFGYLTLTFPSTNPNVLEWSLRPRETSYRNPADRPAVPFLMPMAMTLTRQ